MFMVSNSFVFHFVRLFYVILLLSKVYEMSIVYSGESCRSILALQHHLVPKSCKFFSRFSSTRWVQNEDQVTHFCSNKTIYGEINPLWMVPVLSTMYMGLTFSVFSVFKTRFHHNFRVLLRVSAETMPKIQFSAIFKSKYSYLRFSDVFLLKLLPIVITLGPAYNKLQWADFSSPTSFIVMMPMSKLSPTMSKVLNLYTLSASGT